MQLFDWNIAAASNNSAPPDGAPENMEYDEVNDTMREFMAVLARFYQNGISGTKATAGTTTAYTLTTDFSIAAYAAGQVFSFTAHATSTGSVTLDVDAQGAGNVVDARGVQLGAGDIVNGGFYIVRRTASGTFMVLGALSATSVAAMSGVTLTSAYLAGGTADAITLTPSPAITAYANGQIFAFRANATNTGAMTINISGLGAEALEDYRSAALAAGDVTSGRAYLVIRTGGEWRIIAGLPVDAANDLVGVTPIANGGTAGATAQAGIGALVAALTQVTAASADLIPVGDASDSGNGKKVLASSVAALARGLIAVQAFTASGTYTPTSGMNTCLVISTGGGGGGGGAQCTDSAAGAGGGGGGAGGTCIEFFAAATIGASQSVTIGAAGAAGTDTGGNGGTGGNTTFGSLHTASGGAGGEGVATGASSATSGGAGGAAANGLLNVPGGGGGFGHGGSSTDAAIGALGGLGGASFWGGGGRSRARPHTAGGGSAGTEPGTAGAAYGSGGAGGAALDGSNQAAGGAGAAGVVLVLEFGG